MQTMCLCASSHTNNESSEMSQSISANTPVINKLLTFSVSHYIQTLLQLASQSSISLTASTTPMNNTAGN